MVSRIFIGRPIFAWVIAIVVMLLGLGAIRLLPIAQYPDVAPPQVFVRANYPGASAATIQDSVTQVIEQQLTGIDGLIYFSSTSNSRGSVGVNVVFEKGTNPDIAQVQVQNQVQQALPRLPLPVQQQGLVVRKANPDNLLIVNVYDETDQRTNQDVSDYLVSNLQEPLGRVQGVGDTNVFGAQYAMRIWLNPRQLASFQLMPSDVITAIRNQNTEIAAGELGGQPQPTTQMLNASVTAQSRLQTPEQFADIILKAQENGATVRLKDVARIELGAENYNIISRVNKHPGAGLAIQLAPGADALSTAERVKAEMDRAGKAFPEGIKYTYASDSTDFIKLSIEEVVKTLCWAILFVVLVIFAFLQSWRATLIPAIAVPVVLLGTFAVFYALGYSINTLTLFGLCLAIGLLVDDAIVVVENVKRLMEEDPTLTPRQATIKSMEQITMALVAIAMVLSAVFLPMAFFGGSTGVIYRQFSVSMISAMVLSIGVALILSPALTANLLKQHSEEEPGWLARRAPALFARIRRAGAALDGLFKGKWMQRFQDAIRSMVARKGRYLAIYGAVCVLLVLLFARLPTGFLPTEDQGFALVQYQLPPGATLGRTIQVQRQVENYFADKESSNFKALFSVAGGGGGSSGQNVGNAFLALSDWSKREGRENSAAGITSRASEAFQGIRDAQVFALIPPAVRGLGQSDGFTMELQNNSGMSRPDFAAAANRLLKEAENDPSLRSVRMTELPDVAMLKVNLDQEKLAVLGLSQADVNATLSTAWGGNYVNDFVDKGRVKRVFVQGDAQYRSEPLDLNQWYVRGRGGQMTPFSSFAQFDWSQAPASLSRFNGLPSYEIQGAAAPGKSSGDAMARMTELAAQIKGASVAWSGVSFQERLSSGQAPFLYSVSLLVVFLCLAALYESWSIPVAVLLVVPLGLIGAVLAVTLRGLINDVYLQIGLLTTMGLAAKNAILMIEFAEREEKKGARVLDAALTAARIRLRPILMTSLAFIFGVLPLALASGAGANSRMAIGTAVVGGMLTAMALAVFFIPLFFVIVRRGVRDAMHRLHHHGHGELAPSPPAP